MERREKVQNRDREEIEIVKNAELVENDAGHEAVDGIGRAAVNVMRHELLRLFVQLRRAVFGFVEADYEVAFLF